MLLLLLLLNYEDAISLFRDINEICSEMPHLALLKNPSNSHSQWVHWVHVHPKSGKKLLGVIFRCKL